MRRRRSEVVAGDSSPGSLGWQPTWRGAPGSEQESPRQGPPQGQARPIHHASLAQWPPCPDTPWSRECVAPWKQITRVAESRRQSGRVISLNPALQLQTEKNIIKISDSYICKQRSVRRIRNEWMLKLHLSVCHNSLESVAIVSIHIYA